MTRKREERSGSANRAELAAFLKASRLSNYVDGKPMTRKYASDMLNERGYPISERTLVAIEGTETAVRTKPILQALMDLYEIDDEQQERLLGLWSNDRDRRDWTVAFRPYMTASMTAYVGLEGEAVEALVYHPTAIHGLLQTPEYALATYQAEQILADTTAGFIAKHVELRAERKRRILHRQPKPVRLRVILSEAAVRAHVGSREIMLKQWEDLAFLSRLPHVDIQVLPLVSTGYRVQHDFTILRLRPPLRDLVQADTVWGAVSTTDKPRELERFTNMFNEMSSYALAPADTPEYLHNLAEERVTT
ncbi:DUF5753 domain-containing protein [Streptomyces sp. SID11385]|uniref:DUF5753 domain-containing protein n=1 Tax=Streptomyces sp. SID11385 TaxID=2706031 RepID=UPI0013CD4AD4|nr:DUF5753 domain-containing protein [Streptomyces sp. SID11385]NEA43382.1 XRE family transcriptional regulator [Streptomyces sp. SID11385]